MSTAPALTYDSAMAALFARTAGAIKPGLDRTRALLAELGNPEARFPVFHVAGTNGKGSTCAVIEALLRHRGLKVGRYTSPHLVDFRERITVNGHAISRDEVLAFLQEVDPVAQRLDATFFELTTALAFQHFARAAVDVAVVETGLGGRLDSTNVVTPLVATVTNVSMDHAEYLGDTLPKIAAEKAGIFKAGCPAVVADPTSDMAALLATFASDAGAKPVEVVRERWTATDVTLHTDGTRFRAGTPFGTLHLATPLYGAHQVDNTLAALATVWAAGDTYSIPANELNEALQRVTLPGRFQRTPDGWIFDVAHNPAGAEVLAATVRLAAVPDPIVIVLGVLSDKDWHGMIDLLAPLASTLILTQPASAPAGRAWDPAAAYAYARGEGAQVLLEPDFDTALRRAAALPGTKLVTGSFHTVGDALQRRNMEPLHSAP